MMAYRKPVSTMDYVLHFKNLPHTEESVRTVIEPRINTYLVYGIYPGAGNGFSDPARLALTTPVFARYKPLFKAIHRAGWEPAPKATVDAASTVLYERWGAGPTAYFTLYAKADVPTPVTLSYRPADIGLAGGEAVAELVDGLAATTGEKDGMATVTLTLTPRRTALLRLGEAVE
jgi:hypothetical protein